MKLTLRSVTLIFLSLIRFHNVQAQENSAQNNSYAPPKLGVRIIPTGILNRFNQGIPLGITFAINPSWALIAEGTIPFNRSLTGDKKDFVSQSRYRAEVRHYRHLTPRSRLFFGLEGVFSGQTYHEQQGSIVASGEVQSYAAADVSKKVTEIGLQAGFHFQLGRHFHVEGGTGFGFKQVKITRSNIVINSMPYKAGGTELPTEDQVKDRKTMAYIPFLIGFTYGFGHFRR